MKGFSRTVLPFIAGCALLGASVATNASPFVMTLEEVGSDVVAIGTGSIDDLVDLHPAGSSTSAAFMIPSSGWLSIGSSASNVDFYLGVNGPGAFGLGGESDASSWTGDAAGIFASMNLLAVPAGYVSGEPLSDGMTFANTTFADLGVNPGTYVWQWGSGGEEGSGSFTLQVESIPVPASLPLFASGLGVLALLYSPRKRKAQAGA